jgi:CRISPR-associated protein Cst1
MVKSYDSKMECIDWRYSATILGLIKYFEFENEEYDKLEFRENLGSIEYNYSDISEDRYLAFCEDEFGKDMLHKIVEDIIYSEKFSEEQIKLVNEKLSGNTVMKKVFAKKKFDGSNKNQILGLIKENRHQIIYDTFKNKKNLYANFCNPNLFMAEIQSHCRLVGYSIDEGRKSRSIAYNFNANSFVSVDMLEFDFIPFAFTNTYESFFINNNACISDLKKTNNMLNKMIEEETADNSTGNARTALFKGIISSAEFIDYDVEVIIKNRDNGYFESLFIRKQAVELFKSIGDIKPFSISYKVNDNYYINIQKEVINNILNELVVDDLIELLLKSDRNYSYIVSKLIYVNEKIKGAGQMTDEMKSAYGCARKVVEKIEKNKVKSYRQKLISAIVAGDYNRACDILLQLSSYSDVTFGFAYNLFEDFEKNKDLAYTFINALEKNKGDK